jgi:hypothetical protein
MAKKKQAIEEIPKKKEPRRQFDLRQGARTISIGVRFSPPEYEYIRKIAEKENLSNAAVVGSYFNNWKNKLGHK